MHDPDTLRVYNLKLTDAGISQKYKCNDKIYLDHLPNITHPKKHLNFSLSLELLSPQQNRFTEGQGS